MKGIQNDHMNNKRKLNCKIKTKQTKNTTLSESFQKSIYRPPWPWSHGSWIYNYLCNRWLSPLMLCVRLPLRARSTTLRDKVCQWLAAGRWFFSGSSINKTNRHDITEILLKVALNTIKPNQPKRNQKSIAKS